MTRANPQTEQPTDDRDFSQSFRQTRLLRTGDVCSLKLHFTNAVRDVVGYLDKKAANDPERFVFCKVDTIVQYCHRYHGKQYGKRVVEYVLRYLRKQYVISGRVERYRKQGSYVRLVPGFIVTAHDSLAVRTGNRCEFVGQLNAPGRWQSNLNGTWWVPNGHNSPDAMVTMEKYPESADPSAEHCADPSADHCAEHCADRCADGFENKCGQLCGDLCGAEGEQPSINTEVTEPPCEKEQTLSQAETRSLTVLTESVLLTGLTEGTVGTARQRDQSNGNSKTESQGGDSSLSGLTDQNRKPAAVTIGEALAASMNDDWLAAVSDGELNSNSADEWLRNEWLSKEELRALRACACAAIDSKRDLPHDGRVTQAQLMGDAMKSLSDVHKVKVPACWYPIMKALRSSPGPSRVVAPDLPTYDVCRQELNESRKGPSGRDYEKCKELGLEPCADGIWRPPEGRADKGYTVKGDDGVWREPAVVVNLISTSQWKMLG